jgi:hypothetical protein
MVDSRICQFLNLGEEFFVLRSFLFRVVQVLEQAG